MFKWLFTVGVATAGGGAGGAVLGLLPDWISGGIGVAGGAIAGGVVALVGVVVAQLLASLIGQEGPS